MYLCICCSITDSDVEEKPELANLIGSVCGRCISDGGDLAFDGACEDLIDNSCNDVNIK